MTVTVVLFDSAAGFVRDHPPHAWRAAGILAGPLALVSFACLLHCSAPLWLSLGVVLPFALMASAYSWAWFHRTPAETRRLLGRQALIMGLITVPQSSTATKRRTFTSPVPLSISTTAT